MNSVNSPSPEIPTPSPPEMPDPGQNPEWPTPSPQEAPQQTPNELPPPDRSPEIEPSKNK